MHIIFFKIVCLPKRMSISGIPASEQSNRCSRVRLRQSCNCTALGRLWCLGPCATGSLDARKSIDFVTSHSYFTDLEGAYCDRHTDFHCCQFSFRHQQKKQVANRRRMEEHVVEKVCAEGSVTFISRPATMFRYRIAMKGDDTVYFWLEDTETKHQWCGPA